MNKAALLFDAIFKTEVLIDDARFGIILKKGFFRTLKEDRMWLHCHPDYEVHYITRGAYVFRFELESITCAAGTVVLLPPKCYHTIDPIVEDSDKASFEFTLSRQGKGQAYGDYQTVFGGLQKVLSVTCHIPEFYQIQQMLQSEKSYEALYRLNATLGLCLIRLAECIRGGPPRGDMNIPLNPKKKDDADVMLAHVLNYIEENATQKLTLEQLSRDMNLSERQIQRLLRERMNDNFMSLLNRYRVMTAMRAMGGGERNLGKVAELAGFASYSAFCKYFQRFQGISPDAYRESLKTVEQR